MNWYTLEIDPETIQKLMITKGWSAGDIARKCGVSKETVYRIMKNKRATVKTVHKLCKGLKIPMEEVIMNVR